MKTQNFFTQEINASNLVRSQNGAEATETPDKVDLDISEVLTKGGRYMRFSEFMAYVADIVAFCGTKSRAAKELDINSGFFTQVLEYKQDSPKLRRRLEILRCPPRRRLNIEDPTGNLTETMDAICAAEGITRPELQAWMLRNHLEFHGDLVDCDYRELEY